MSALEPSRLQACSPAPTLGRDRRTCVRRREAQVLGRAPRRGPPPPGRGASRQARLPGGRAWRCRCPVEACQVGVPARRARPGADPAGSGPPAPPGRAVARPATGPAGRTVSPSSAEPGPPRDSCRSAALIAAQFARTSSAPDTRTSPNTCGMPAHELAHDGIGHVVDRESGAVDALGGDAGREIPPGAGRRRVRPAARCASPDSSASSASYDSSIRCGASERCVCLASHGQSVRSVSMVATRSSSLPPGRSCEPSSTSASKPASAIAVEQVILARMRGEPHDRRASAGQGDQPPGPRGGGVRKVRVPTQSRPDRALRAADDRAIRQGPCAPRGAPPRPAGSAGRAPPSGWCGARSIGRAPACCPSACHPACCHRPGIACCLPACCLPADRRHGRPLIPPRLLSPETAEGPRGRPSSTAGSVAG